MKQLASTYIFVSILCLLLISLVFIFTHMPAQKSGFFERKASRAFYDSQNRKISADQRMQAAQSAKKYFIMALRQNPHDAALWIRLASVQKMLGNMQDSDNDTFTDALRIARRLRPDIRPDLDRIIIQINNDKRIRGKDE